jgi:hypothetical protein
MGALERIGNPGSRHDWESVKSKVRMFPVFAVQNCRIRTRARIDNACGLVRSCNCARYYDA